MKIVKLVVTDEEGMEHEWTGRGFVHVRATSKKGEPYTQMVDAGLTLPSLDIKPDGP